MKLLALVRPPQDAAKDAELLAEVTGMTIAEARMRLAPEPPALLARLAEAPALAALTRLKAAGLPVLLLDEAVPQDARRFRVRAFQMTSEEGSFVSRAGDRLAMRWSDVFLVLKASSAVRSSTEQSEKSRQFDLGTAVLTSGLKMTKKVEKTTRTQTLELESSIFVFDRQGPCAVFREREVDFSCLGTDMQPVRNANMATLAKWLRARAPGALYDDRLVRLGNRSLPFVFGGETRMAGSGVTQTRQSTAAAVDVLVEVLRQAVVQGLLGT